MDWIGKLRDALDTTSSGVPERLRPRYDAWRRLPSPRADAPHVRTRYVVVDVEASGLDADRDRLISIGAVAVDGGLIDPADAFEIVLRQDEASSASNIVGHGISVSEQRAGVEPADALIAFLEFVGKAPLVSYRIAFKAAMIGRAAQSCLGTRPEFVWIDLAPVAGDLFPEHRDLPEELDAWLGAFNIPNFRQHHAVADCYAMAQLLQVTLRRAAAGHAGSFSRLVEIERTRRRLRPS